MELPGKMDQNLQGCVRIGPIERTVRTTLAGVMQNLRCSHRIPSAEST
jgi:hypothetical protein